MKTTKIKNKIKKIKRNGNKLQYKIKLTKEHTKENMKHTMKNILTNEHI